MGCARNISRQEPQSARRLIRNLLASEASDQMPAALEGDLEALREFAQEAERLLESEDVQRLVSSMAD